MEAKQVDDAEVNLGCGLRTLCSDLPSTVSDAACLAAEAARTTYQDSTFLLTVY